MDKMLDAVDVLPGWKSAVLGLLGTLAPFFDELLPYLGYEPIPPNLMLTGQALLVALIACAMMLKARRGPQRS